MITKYMVRWGRNSIYTINVKGETECFVILEDGRREKKRTNGWHNYFDTWERAHDHLLERCQEKIKLANMRLKNTRGDITDAECELVNILAMKEPEDTQ